MEKHLRPCLAELIGTFAFCFIGAGAICTNVLTNGAVGLAGIAIAHGLILSIVVTATMNISGGHINPAVTITMWVYKKIETDRMLFYVASQLIGGIIAGGLLTAIFGNTKAMTEGHLGTPHLGLDNLGVASRDNWYSFLALGIGVEIILSFLLLYAIFGTAVDPRAPRVGGFGIGLTVAACILMGGPLTGASMNPARTLGPGIWEAGVMGFGVMRDHAVYWIGPILGGILAGGLYMSYILPEEKHP